MPRAMCLALTLGLIAGCASARRPIPSAAVSPHRAVPKPPATAPPPAPSWATLPAFPGPSPFSVVAEGWEGDPESPRWLHVCRLDGLTAFCQTSIGFSNGKRTDFPFMFPSKVAGSWPGQAWGVGTVEVDCSTSCAAPHRTALFRFVPDRGGSSEHKTNGAWREVGSFKPKYASFFENNQVFVGPWRNGRVLVLEQFFDWMTDGAPTYLEWSSHGAGKSPDVPKLTVRDGKRLADHVTSVLSFASGEVFVLASAAEGVEEAKRGRTVVERWTGHPMRHVVDMDPELGGCSFSNMTGNSPTQVALVGEAADVPCVRRFDGSGYQIVELPAWGQRALAYAMEPRGVEWLVLGLGSDGFGNPAESALFARLPGRIWRRVPLPEPLYERLHRDRTIEPLDVFVQSDGSGGGEILEDDHGITLGRAEVWVVGRYLDHCDRAVVLSTRSTQTYEEPSRVDDICPGRIQATPASTHGP